VLENRLKGIEHEKDEARREIAFGLSLVSEMAELVDLSETREKELLDQINRLEANLRARDEELMKIKEDGGGGKDSTSIKEGVTLGSGSSCVAPKELELLENAVTELRNRLQVLQEALEQKNEELRIATSAQESMHLQEGVPSERNMGHVDLIHAPEGSRALSAIVECTILSKDIDLKTKAATIEQLTQRNAVLERERAQQEALHQSVNCLIP